MPSLERGLMNNTRAGASTFVGYTWKEKRHYRYANSV
jgi:hypothetical protein